MLLHDATKIEFSKNEKDRNNRETESDFVRNHLSGSANAAQEGKLGIGGPTSNRDSVNGQRRDGEDKEGTNIEVSNGHGERDLAAFNRNGTSKWDHRYRNQGRHHRHTRSEPEEVFANVVRGEVFLEDKLKSVSNGLGQTTEGKFDVVLEAQNGSWDHGPVGADAVLDDGGEAALGINRVGHEGENYREVEANFDGGGDEKDSVHWESYQLLVIGC